MNKLYAKCSQCNRVIYASQAAENGGICGPDCPQGEALPRVARRQPVAAVAPVVPPVEILLPVEPIEPPEPDGEAPVGDDEAAPESLPALVPALAPEPASAARAATPGQNRMQGRRENR